ncbi:hypothetical protein FBUS_00264, partial [Fasciolopsis buskii]
NDESSGAHSVLNSFPSYIYSDDVDFSDDIVPWFGAFDACAAKQRVFSFPAASKHFRLVMLKMDKRTAWLEYYKAPWGWTGHSGIQKATIAWETPEDENATVGSCAVLKKNGKLSARDCLEYHYATCINPNLFESRRRRGPP